MVSKSRSGTPLDSDLVILPFPILNFLGLPGKQRWKKGALILGQRGKSDTTDKPKVSVAVVVESDKVNSADFDKLKSLACKMEEENRKTQILMKDIQDALRFKEI